MTTKDAIMGFGMFYTIAVKLRSDFELHEKILEQYRMRLAT